jgi:hypothetical protein
VLRPGRGGRTSLWPSAKLGGRAEVDNNGPVYLSSMYAADNIVRRDTRGLFFSSSSSSFLLRRRNIASFIGGCLVDQRLRWGTIHSMEKGGFRELNTCLQQTAAPPSAAHQMEKVSLPPPPNPDPGHYRRMDELQFRTHPISILFVLGSSFPNNPPSPIIHLHLDDSVVVAVRRYTYVALVRFLDVAHTTSSCSLPLSLSPSLSARTIWSAHN